jgi:DNA-binding transcriptional MerR regulator
MKYYTIGQLAKLIQQTTVTIRYYEKFGLIPQAKRSNGGFRLYPESLIPRFYFIQNAKKIGFDLTETKNLLELQTNKAPSQAIKLRMQEKINHIESQISHLQKIRQALLDWEKACDGKMAIEACPILAALYHRPESIKACWQDKQK